MNKWGVRLIGFLFLIEAIYYFLPLITKTWHATSFWALDLVYAIAFLYTGIQLLRFHPSGRNWALFILWVAAVFAGIFLLWFIVQLATSSISFGGPTWLSESNRPIFALSIFFGLVLLCFIPIYYLMRKDVKQLFEKSVLSKESTPTSDAAPS